MRSALFPIVLVNPVTVNSIAYLPAVVPRSTFLLWYAYAFKRMTPHQSGFRRTARLFALAALTACVLAGPACREGYDGPADGVTPEASFGPTVESLMAKWSIPGGAAALVRDGRLVYAQGFGFADRERRRPATPATLFRIASLSKPVTAAAVLKLVEQGRLALDDHPFLILDDLKPPAGAFLDPRIYDITAREALR